MKVSIIVPCYKVEKYLSICIESVLHQSYSDWELILVDDGSPDHCGRICDEYAKTDSRIVVIHKLNGGLSSARNAGLDAMNGEYVTFLDSDDFWHQDYLTVLMDLIENEGADIAQCDFVKGIESTFPLINIPMSVSRYDNHTIFTKQAAKIIVWGKIYKVSLFDDVRMPVGKIHEDDWTTWKLYYKAKKVIVTKQPLYYYTQNPNSIMGINKIKPDITYFGAYQERINFFLSVGEKDLEHISRMHFCKTLILLYSNKMLSEEDRSEIRKCYSDNWCHLKHSVVVPISLKILFFLFACSPVPVCTILDKLGIE